MLRSAVRLAAAVGQSPRPKLQLPPNALRHGTGWHSWTPDNTAEFVMRQVAADKFDPILVLFKELRNPENMPPILRALGKNKIAIPEYLRWKPVLAAEDIDKAMIVIKEAEEKRESSSAVQWDGARVPVWVLLYLVTYKVKSAPQAADSLQNFLHTYLPSISEHYKPHFFILATIALGTYRVQWPVPDLTQQFLNISFSQLPKSETERYYNLFIYALSRFPRSHILLDATLSVLDAMRNHDVRVVGRSYDALLSPHFIMPSLARVIRDTMHHANHMPTPFQLESFLRSFAKSGSKDDVDAFMNSILERNKANGASAAENRALMKRAKTLHLRSLQDRTSAFRVLDDMLNEERSEVDKNQQVPLASDANRNARFITPNKGRKKNWRPGDWFQLKKGVDIYDWTSALHVAGKDPSTTTEQLSRLFHHSQEMIGTLRPTMVTYTVMMRAFLYRKAYDEAEKIWGEMRSSGLQLDESALTTVLHLLTRTGRPHEAFQLLESYVSKQPGDGGMALSIIALNEFMVSLLRIARPDIIFILWFHMFDLYTLRPDRNSLNILTKAATLASRLDDSVKGAWEQFRSQTPFRRTVSSPADRDAIIASIVELLGDKESGLRPYTFTQWNNEPAWKAARTVFRDAVLGNWQVLRTVQSPATAVRSSPDGAAMRPMIDLWRSVTGRSESDHFQEEHFSQEFRSVYPGVTLTDRNFQAYIQLLGLNSLASEIPLALAWMRQLNVHPTEDTLAMALVFWSEVSLRAPMVEQWSSLRGRSEYMKLEDWIVDWVGRKEAPRQPTMKEWLLLVNHMRNLPRRSGLMNKNV